MSTLKDRARRRAWLKRAWRSLTIFLVIITVILPGGMAATAGYPTGDRLGEGAATDSGAGGAGGRLVQLAAKPTPTVDPNWPACLGGDCPANDVQATGAWLGDETGQELDTCTVGEAVSATIWVDFNSNARRYAIALIGDVYVANTFQEHVDACALDEISGTQSLPLYSFYWTCGGVVEVRSLAVVWDANPGSCADYQRQCNDYPPPKCYYTDTLRVDAPLVVDFASNAPHCLGVTTVFTSNVTGGAEPYTYTWAFGDSDASGQADPQHYYTAAGTYTVTLTVTDSKGRVASATDSVTVWAAPEVELSAERLVLPCVDGSSALTATVTSGTGPFTYAWYNGASLVATHGPTSATTDGYSAGDAGVYSVVVSDANGCSDRSNEVTLSDAPGVDVTLSAERLVLPCVEGSSALTATVTSGTGPFTYAWYNGASLVATHGPTSATTDGYSAGDAGVYSVVVSDANGCTDRSNEVTLSDAPGVDVTLSAERLVLPCVEGSSALTATVTSGTGPFTYAWYNGASLVATHGPTSATTDGYSAGDAGVYSVVVSDANGCTDTSDTVTLRDAPGVSVSVSPSEAVLTCDDPSALLTASTDGEGEFSYQWYKDGGPVGQDDYQLTVNAAGIYTVTVTDLSTGCTATSNEASVSQAGGVSVSVSPSEAVLTCDEPGALLTATASGEGTLSYQWYKDGGPVGQDDYQLTVSAAGIYTVTVTDLSTGCTATSNEASVSQAGGVSVSVSPSEAVLTCDDPSAVLTASTDGEGDFSYQWYKDGGPVGQDDYQLTVSAAGIYTVTVTDLGTGCTGTSNEASVSQAGGPSVSVLPPSAQLDCTTGEALLTAIVAEGTGTPPYEYQWYLEGVEISDATESEYVATVPGTYHVQVTDANGCPAESNRVPVSPCELPGLDISKTGDKTTASIGDVVDYTIVVENTGDVTLHNVTVVDAKLGINEIVGTLAPEETATVTGSYDVTEADLGGIHNTATADSDEVGPVTASWDVTVAGGPGLQITKSADSDVVQVGDVIHYTIKVRNTGDVTLHNVTVVDAKLGINQNVGDLAPGASATVAGSYGPVSEQDKPGPIVNTATATSAETPEPVQASCSVGINIPPPPPCTRTDLSVVIYGGWNGLPVKAWVGGTEQPTLYTALDSSGRPSCSWTFYVPEGVVWQVRVEPQLASGMDGGRWKYKPGSKQVSIRGCRRYKLEFQLVDMGGPTPEPTPELLLPVTGTQPAARWSPAQYLASCWQRLARLWRGLFTR